MTNGLWDRLSNRHTNNVATSKKDNSNQSLLYQALMMSGNGSPSSSGGWGNSSSSGSLSDGLSKIGKVVTEFKGSNSGGGLGTIGTTANDFITGSSSSSGSAISDAINGVGGSSGSSISNAINGATGGSAADSVGGIFSNGSGSAGTSAGSAASNVPWAAIAGIAKKGYNSISGHDDKEYSDLEEGVIYPLQGAATGSMFGPWGAAAGALYGLGYSFKDDLGLKDSNFLTQTLFPIGMGDGGGLRIGGKSILDLG